MSSTPRLMVLSLCRSTGGCCTTATRWGLAAFFFAMAPMLTALQAGGLDGGGKIPGAHDHARQQIVEVLGGDVAGRLGREWAPAGAAHRRVQGNHPALERRQRVRIA